jgi:hypothetical protein
MVDMFALDLNTKSATKLTTEVETDPALTTTFGQFQNIGLIGTMYIYLYSSW